MPTNKLPVLGGGERELRDGDRFMVKLEDGSILNAKRDNRGYCGNVGRFWMRWNFDGTVLMPCSPAGSYPDIVLILGPESVDNGDGTVTKVRTVSVSGPPERVERLSIVDVRDLGYIWDSHGGYNGGKEVLWFTPLEQPAPSAFEKELARRVKDGEVVLPPRATKMWLHCGDWRFNDGDPSFVEVDWKQLYLGPLPSLKDFPHNGDTVSLDEVREMVKEESGAA